MIPRQEDRAPSRGRPDFQGCDVLVTGGLGFVGSHLTAYLVTLGARVTVIDCHASPSRESLINLRPDLRRSIRVVEGSINDFEIVRSLIASSEFSVIFHCATFASTIERGARFPRETVQTNVLGLVNLLEAIRTTPGVLQAFVHASTDKVYGDSGGEPYDEHLTPLRAAGVYDVSKMAADALARMYHEVYGVPTVVARLCNIFGPYDFHTEERIVPRAMKALFAADRPNPPALYENSSRHGRDYLYVEDAVDALLLLATCRACTGGVFNLPGCRHLATPAMLQAILLAAETVEREHDPARADLIRSTGYTTVAGSTEGPITIPTQTSLAERLREATGFSPRVGLDDGLRATCLGYRSLYRSQSSASRHLVFHPAHPMRRSGRKSGSPTPWRGGKP